MGKGGEPDVTISLYSVLSRICDLQGFEGDGERGIWGKEENQMSRYHFTVSYHRYVIIKVLKVMGGDGEHKLKHRGSCKKRGRIQVNNNLKILTFAKEAKSHWPGNKCGRRLR